MTACPRWGLPQPAVHAAAPSHIVLLLTTPSSHTPCRVQVTFFVQAQPFDHSPHLERAVAALQVNSTSPFVPLSVLHKRFRADGSPYVEYLAERLREVWRRVFGTRPPRALSCFGNALFAVHRRAVLSRPRAFYRTLLQSVDGSWPVYTPRSAAVQEAWERIGVRAAPS